MQNEIKKQLEELAYKRSIPFCYSDYMECPSGRCLKCGSDDLMRLVPGVGCEWGIEWVIQHILETELEAVDLEESFEESIRELYPETTKVGWMEFDTVKLMKENDPVGWRCALADYESEELGEGNILSFDNGSTNYRTSDLLELIEA
ncbi:MAG: hypothetical protein JNJ49_12055 [Bdellovibrionaceae bacterium]|nr:hypothetical protein [Pseudobdellovibrionaceae bacterium]